MRFKRQYFLLLAGILIGCQIPRYYHTPGGPYYFKSAVTYQGFRPSGEMSKQEADALAQQGYAYTVAYFDGDGQPTTIEKIHEGRVAHHIDLVYSNRVLVDTILIDTNGIQRHIPERTR